MTAIKYEFGSTLYRNQQQMLDGMAYEFMTGQGWNNQAQVDELVANGTTGESSVDECIEGWGLDRGDDFDPEVLSHMAFNDYTRTDLAEAIQRFIATRPDKIDCDEA